MSGNKTVQQFAMVDGERVAIGVRAVKTGETVKGAKAEVAAAAAKPEPAKPAKA